MRSVSGEDYFSMVMPLQVQGRRVGAIEIVKSISFVKADKEMGVMVVLSSQSPRLRRGHFLLGSDYGKTC